jgi:hypothetical protein
MNIAPLASIAVTAAEAPAQTTEDFQFSAGVITGYTGSETAGKTAKEYDNGQVGDFFQNN